MPCFAQLLQHSRMNQDGLGGRLYVSILRPCGAELFLENKPLGANPNPNLRSHLWSVNRTRSSRYESFQASNKKQASGENSRDEKRPPLCPILTTQPFTSTALTFLGVDKNCCCYYELCWASHEYHIETLNFLSPLRSFIASATTQA
jgi:hypothetical protein